jgi:amino acid transporter
MSSFPPFLVVVILGFVLSTILMLVATMKTVRYHGWRQRKWAPPAVPWYIAAMAVLVLTLAVAFLVM